MLDNTKFKTGLDYYHRLNFIFNLMIALPLVPFAILYLGRLKDNLPPFEIDDPLKLAIDAILVILSTSLVIWAVYSYNREKLSIAKEQTLRKKMVELHNLLIRIFGWLVIGSFLASLGLFITGSKVHIVSFVVILVIFSLKRPSLKMIVEELGLNEDESMILRERRVIE